MRKNPKRTRQRPAGRSKRVRRKGRTRKRLIPEKWAEKERTLMDQATREGKSPQAAARWAGQEMRKRYRMQTRRGK